MNISSEEMHISTIQKNILIEHHMISIKNYNIIEKI